MEGDLAEAAIWNEALSAAEVALLAQGLSPLSLRPWALVFYAPIYGRYDPEIDIIGGLNLTVLDATASAHPRIFKPGLPQISVPVAAGEGGGWPAPLREGFALPVLTPGLLS